MGRNTGESHLEKKKKINGEIKKKISKREY